MNDKITEFYVFVMEDNEGNEAIMGIKLLGQWFQFLGSNPEKLEKMVELAESISLQLERPYKVLKFKLVGTIVNDTAQAIRPDNFGHC